MDTTVDTPADTTTTRAHGVFEIVFGALILAGNVLVLAAAWQDKGLGALLLAIVGGPILNGIFLTSGLVAMPFLKRRRLQFSLSRHLLLTVGIPIAAVVVDFFTIKWMGVSVC